MKTAAKRAKPAPQDNAEKSLLVRMPASLHNAFKVWTAQRNTSMSAEILEFIKSRTRA